MYNHWSIQELTGYVPKTTFYTDLGIAEEFGGVNAIKDTYDRVFETWKDDVVFITEFCMALNWKAWEWADRDNQELVELYSNLWCKLDNWLFDNLKNDDLDYYLRTTD